ncbi:MAG: hypothetical protein R3F33_14780 [Planctomycetota bacterium]
MWKLLTPLACLATTGLVYSLQTNSVPAVQSFDEIELYLQAHAADESGEIILRVEGQEEMKRLTVKDPFGAMVYDLHFDDPAGLGSSEVHIESGEPSLPMMRKSVPEGSYEIVALTQAGGTIVGHATLRFDLPSRFGWTTPAPGGVLPAENAVLAWVDQPNVAAYTLEVDDQDDDPRMTVHLPAGTAHFQVPAAVLTPGSTHKAVLTAILEGSGNRLVQELPFFVLP